MFLILTTAFADIAPMPGDPRPYKRPRAEEPVRPPPPAYPICDVRVPTCEVFGKPGVCVEGSCKPAPSKPVETPVIPEVPVPQEPKKIVEETNSGGCSSIPSAAMAAPGFALLWLVVGRRRT